MIVGLFAVSSAAIIIRLAQEGGVPSLTIAGGRLVVATIVLTPLTLRNHREDLRKLGRKELGLCLLAGVILAGHFAAWVSSLGYTSVAASVVLVSTYPVMIAVLSYPLLGERVSLFVGFGTLLAFIGGIIVALSGDAGEPPGRADALLGNGLAFVGAVAVAIYFIIGRRVRARLPVIPYIWLVYGSAALTMIFVVGITGQQVGGFSWDAYLWVVMLGLVPQLIGHSAFNYALGYLPAAFVTLVILAEPVVSTTLAALLLEEFPAVWAVIGGAIILSGIGVASIQTHGHDIPDDATLVAAE
jgi:drug/metabolite transporter (DMT)-like permease